MMRHIPLLGAEFAFCFAISYALAAAFSETSARESAFLAAVTCFCASNKLFRASTRSVFALSSAIFSGGCTIFLLVVRGATTEALGKTVEAAGFLLGDFISSFLITFEYVLAGTLPAIGGKLGDAEVSIAKDDVVNSKTPRRLAEATTERACCSKLTSSFANLHSAAGQVVGIARDCSTGLFSGAKAEALKIAAKDVTIKALTNKTLIMIADDFSIFVG